MISARETGDSLRAHKLSPAVAGSPPHDSVNLGLAPQALCFRLLRRLRPPWFSGFSVITHRSSLKITSRCRKHFVCEVTQRMVVTCQFHKWWELPPANFFSAFATGCERTARL